LGELKEGASLVTYSFGPFLLDPAQCRLSRDGQDLRLPPKVFETLVLLVERQGLLVEKDDLMKALWPDMFVEEVTLARNISLLRKALGDAPGQDQSRYIETVSKRGYRFIGKVTKNDGPETPVEQTRTAALSRSPSGKRRARVGAVALAVFIVGIGAFWAYHFLHRPPAGIRSLAVLPLENLSSSPEQEYFADAMTDELITDLAQIHSLRVISRSSVMQFKHPKENLREIAAALNVDAVVEGSVSRDGSRVHITAQLLDAREDRHLWAATYERPLQDVLSLQSQIANAIADQVEAKLTPAESARLTKPRPINQESYDALVQGRFLRNRRAPAEMQKALAYFQRAVASDPGSAEAWAALGDCYASLGGDQGSADPNSVRPLARDALTKALELDPDLAEAHSSMGWYKMWFEWDSPGAEREFLRGIELSPNSSTAHRYYAFYLRIRRRFDEALEQNRLAMELSPLDILPQGLLVMIYAAQGEEEKVLAQANRVLEIDPDFTGVYVGIAGVFRARHQWREAYAALEHVKNSYRTDYLFGVASVAASAGDMRRARSAMADLEEYARHDYVSPLAFAFYEAKFGDREKAFQWLEKGFKEHATDMIELDVEGVNSLSDPTCGFGASDPRFRELIRRIGFR
jgi:TolB-like protein/DNA-binding winged helix-turn-helix (wHTH) protein/Tfp pilus assembly protein PilF